MSIQDRIAKRLLAAHGKSLPRKISASGWWTSIKKSVEDADQSVLEQHSAKVIFGDKQAKLTCEVAGDEESQTVGLQKYANLPNGYGMIFPYSPPRPKIAFHMGTVPFPIDIIFVGQDGRVTKIVPDIEPGTRGSWSMSHVAAVVEANAGFCRQHGIEVGTTVSTGLEKKAQEVFTPDPRKDINPKMAPANDIEDRFKGHDTPDNVLDNQPMDGGHWESQMGHDPSMAEQQDLVPPIRSGARKIKK